MHEIDRQGGIKKEQRKHLTGVDEVLAFAAQWPATRTEELTGVSPEDIAEMVALADQVLADTSDAPALLLDGPGAELSAWRDWSTDADVIAESGAFERLDIWTRIEALKGTRHDLPGGAWMSVEPTAGLVSIDVNTGAEISPAACLRRR